MSNYKEFVKLHFGKEPLVLGNVWDAGSVRISEKLGYKALGTSSAAIAAMFGFEDGEKIEFHTLVDVVKHMMRLTKLPLSVDIESGYGETADDVVNNIQQLSALGVVGINIEDSRVKGERKLLRTEEFSKMLNQIKVQLDRRGISMFLNVRTDAYLLGNANAFDESIDRVQAYEASGADGIFVPCITNMNEIAQVVAATNLPVNVICMPELPSFADLRKAGVKRVSSGNFIHQYLSNQLEIISSKILNQQSFQVLFK